MAERFGNRYAAGPEARLRHVDTRCFRGVFVARNRRILGINTVDHPTPARPGIPGSEEQIAAR